MLTGVDKKMKAIGPRIIVEKLAKPKEKVPESLLTWPLKKAKALSVGSPRTTSDVQEEEWILYRSSHEDIPFDDNNLVDYERWVINKSQVIRTLDINEYNDTDLEDSKARHRAGSKSINK